MSDSQGGCNRGAKAALENGSEVLLFLNNDARVSPSDLERLAETVESGRYGVAGGVNYQPSMPEKVFSAGQRFLWLICRIQRVSSLPPSDAPQQVPIVIGSCFAIHRRVFEKIGFLDERFFIYYEEADLCLRAKEGGFGVAYHPQVKVLHEGGATFGQKGT